MKKECRECLEPFEDFMDQKEDGWWCEDCDTYNFFDEANYSNHKFTIIYEDKYKAEKFPRKSPLKFKQQLSPFRYPGGKSKMIPYLATLLRANKCEALTSPFSGGASFELAMLESKMVDKVLLNDIDFGIYSVWWAILNMPDELIHRINTFKPTVENFFLSQEKIKKDYHSLDLMDAAWHTLLVNRLAYSGILMANPLGGKNGDITALTSRWNPASLSKRINQIHQMNSRIELFNVDSIDFIADYFWSDKTTLFIDPPYLEKGEQLYPHAYQEQDHINLAFMLDGLHRSYPNSDIIVTYDYNKWLQSQYVHVDEEIIIGRNYSI